MKLKRLKIPSVTIVVYSSAGKAIKKTKVGPFILKPKKYNDGHTWKLVDENCKDKVSNRGEIFVAPRFNAHNDMCVCSVNIDHELRGLGIGKQIYQHLANVYGALESDPRGTTSEQAKRVWKSLKAKKSNYTCPYGSSSIRFRIESKINPKTEESSWTSFIWNMMNWLRPERSIR